MIQEELVGLGIETFKIALILALPSLLVGMFLGLSSAIYHECPDKDKRTNLSLDSPISYGNSIQK